MNNRIMRKLYNIIMYPFKYHAKVIETQLQIMSLYKDYSQSVEVAKQLNIPILRTQQKPEEFIKLLSFLRQLKPKMILQIGTKYGGSLYFLSQIAPPDATLISVDLSYPKSTIDFFEDYKHKNQSIYIVQGDSHSSDTFNKVKRILGNRTLDFLFIDGDHSYEGVKHDYYSYSALLSPRGIVAFHDIVGHRHDCMVGFLWDELKQDEDSRILEYVSNRYYYGIDGGIGILKKEKLSRRSK